MGYSSVYHHDGKEIFSPDEKHEETFYQEILVVHHDEFQSKEYWDSFFAQRGDEAFEWYGSYADLRGFCLRHLTTHDKILMLGCGNSSFSADLYDNSYTSIVNVDFSEALIDSMRTQNLGARPLMSWEVMDMTALTCADQSFDVVLDKGALDALLSADDAALLQKASDMFAHIDRVLVPGGKYLCVSLCEDYIAAHLLHSFLVSHNHSHARAYSLGIEIVTPTTPSPFKPFFLTFTKPKPSASAGVTSAAQTQARVQVHFDSFGSPTRAPSSLTLPATTDLILQAHSCAQKRFQLSKVQPGRYEVFEVHARGADYCDPDSPEGAGVGGGTDPSDIPRFSVLIFDHAARAARSCAVFFVPPGRETDYQFTSEAGLAELATQAQCRRLLAVRCNRPHVFPPMADLQSELSPIAMYLAPADCGPPDEDPIPFLAVQQDSDWAEVERGALQVAGSFVVEEMAAEDEADCDKFVWRRLVFLENQHFIQTEAKLLCPASAGSTSSAGKKAKGGAASKKKKGGGKSKGKAKKAGGAEEDASSSSGGRDLFLFDHSYLDDHHKAMLVALLCDNTALISTGSRARSGEGEKGGEEGVRALLVGLGGGALAMALQRYLPALRLDVVDLVPGLDALAARHFGFIAGPRCRTLVQDGVQYIMQQQQGQGQEQGQPSPSSSGSVFTAVEEADSSSGSSSGEGVRYHSVLLDVDSKDNALGLSAPPAAFLTRAFLAHLHDRVLLPGGSLCLNVVARDKSKLAALIALLKDIFSVPPVSGSVSEAEPAGAVSQAGGGQAKVYLLKPSAETVNLTLHAVKRSSTLPAGAEVGGTQQQQQPLAGLAKQLQALAVSASSNSKHKKANSSGGNKWKSNNTKTDGAGNSSNLASSIAELKARERCLDDWLSSVKLSNDPLALTAMLDNIVEA